LSTLYADNLALQHAYRNRNITQPSITFTYRRDEEFEDIDENDPRFDHIPILPVPSYLSDPGFIPFSPVGDYLFESTLSCQKAMEFTYAAIRLDEDFHALTFIEQRNTLSVVRSEHGAAGIEAMRVKNRYSHEFDPLQPFKDAMDEISQGELTTPEPTLPVFLKCMICLRQVLKSETSGWRSNSTTLRLEFSKISTCKQQEHEQLCNPKQTCGITLIISPVFEIKFGVKDSMQYLFLNYFYYKMSSELVSSFLF
jgi:hypothetical protein